MGRLSDRFFAVACSFAALSFAAFAASASPSLHVEGGRFKDAAGRTVVLRGVNVAGSSKVPPFTPAMDPAVFDPLRAAGMNVVRLLFTWEAYEPQKGAYDKAYLDYYASAVAAARDRGLFVIVDFHQDAFSRFSLGGCGDGFPAWALPASIQPAKPDNGPACANWGVKMQTDKDMMAAWTAFYAGEGGVRDRYLAMLESVSGRLAAEPAVIGYDLLNEPWGDEPTEIAPLHADAAAALRKQSPEAIVFVSPHARTSAGSQTNLPEPAFSNFAYSPHFYDSSVVLFKSWSGIEPDKPFDGMSAKATEWGAPLFVGEFGAPGLTENVEGYMDTLYRHLDARFASGAQWTYTPGWSATTKDGWNDEDFSILDGAGAPRPNFHPRPYAPAIAGEPTLFQVTQADSAEGRSIELDWQNDPKLGATEIFVPAKDFFGTDAIAFETTGAGLSCAAAEGSRVSCSSAEAGAMRVVVRKAAASPPGPEPGKCGLVGIEMLMLWPLARLGRLARRRRRAG
jgi:endoglycosylceramidase